MIVTEAEAKKLMCPMALSGSVRYTNDQNCVGSKCMAWVSMSESLTAQGKPFIDESGEPLGSCGMLVRR